MGSGELIYGGGSAVFGIVSAVLLRRVPKPFLWTGIASLIGAAAVALAVVAVFGAIESVKQSGFDVSRALLSVVATFYLVGIGLSVLCGITSLVAGLAMQSILQVGKRLKQPLQQMTGNEYIPQVTAQDIQRIVNRDFPEHERARVLSTLSGYGTDSSLSGRTRVHAAILKLSAGNAERVSAYVVVANSDFRDVLAPAESPRFWEVGFVGVSRMSAKEVEHLQGDDWAQYLEWLNRAS